MFDQYVLKCLNRMISGPLDGPIVMLKTSSRIISWMWCLQAKYNTFLSSRHSSKIYFLLFSPVLLACTKAQCPEAVLDAPIRYNFHYCMALPVPEGSFGTAKSWSIPDPDPRTGSWSTFSSPVRSFMSFPSQWRAFLGSI